MHTILIIGGGAAGFFAAIAAKTAQPHSKVAILEKSAALLSKVRISGGGRCNVTHSCFDPKELVHNYPRGSKELLGPFHRFGPSQTIEWFEARGVRLKTEKDGRIFPVTDSSQTIIDALLQEAKRLSIEIHLRQRIARIEKRGEVFELHMQEGALLQCNRLILATGSSPEGHAWAAALGHTIDPPVPSLFAFNIPHSPLKELSGISVENVEVRLEGSSYIQKGPLLITHLGVSGPAILKLSAWAARYLHSLHYQTIMRINWLPAYDSQSLYDTLLAEKAAHPDKALSSLVRFELPKSLWKHLVPSKRLGALSNREIKQIAERLQNDPYSIDGKTTNKEEFVTCGGVCLKEIDFKTMQSKRCPGLFFAGEILAIDGVTGGFNFQNAWTTGYIAGSSGSESS